MDDIYNHSNSDVIERGIIHGVFIGSISMGFIVCVNICFFRAIRKGLKLCSKYIMLVPCIACFTWLLYTFSALDLFHLIIWFVQFQLIDVFKLLQLFYPARNYFAIYPKWISYIWLNLFFTYNSKFSVCLEYLQRYACFDNIFSLLNQQNRCLLQESLLTYPNLVLFYRLIDYKCTFIGLNSSNPPFLTQLRTALQWDSKDRLISFHEHMTSNGDKLNTWGNLPWKIEKIPTRELWKQMEAQLAIAGTKLAVLLLFRKKITVRIGRLPRDLLREIVIYL